MKLILPAADRHYVSTAAAILKYGRYHTMKSPYIRRRTTNIYEHYNLRDIHEYLRILRSKVTDTRSLMRTTTTTTTTMMMMMMLRGVATFSALGGTSN